MEERILEILKTLVAMKSVSCSTVEVEPAEWFAALSLIHISIVYREIL